MDSCGDASLTPRPVLMRSCCRKRAHCVVSCGDVPNLEPLDDLELVALQTCEPVLTGRGSIGHRDDRRYMLILI